MQQDSSWPPNLIELGNNGPSRSAFDVGPKSGIRSSSSGNTSDSNRSVAIQKYGGMINSTLAPHLEGISLSSLAMKFCQDWDLSPDNIAYELGYPDFGKLIESSVLQEFIEEQVSNGSIVYCPRALTCNEHILRVQADVNLRLEQWKEKAKAQRQVQLMKISNSPTYITGKRRILKILLGLEAYSEPVSYSKLQEAYLIRYGAVLNSEENNRLFGSKKALKNLLNAFYEEIEVLSGSPITLKLKSREIKLPEMPAQEVGETMKPDASVTLPRYSIDGSQKILVEKRQEARNKTLLELMTNPEALVGPNKCSASKNEPASEGEFKEQSAALQNASSKPLADAQHLANEKESGVFKKELKYTDDDESSDSDDTENYRKSAIKVVSKKSSATKGLRPRKHPPPATTCPPLLDLDLLKDMGDWDGSNNLICSEKQENGSNRFAKQSSVERDSRTNSVRRLDPVIDYQDEIRNHDSDGNYRHRVRNHDPGASYRRGVRNYDLDDSHRREVRNHESDSSHRREVRTRDSNANYRREVRKYDSDANYHNEERHRDPGANYRREVRNYGPDANHHDEERHHDPDANYRREVRNYGPDANYHDEERHHDPDANYRREVRNYSPDTNYHDDERHHDLDANYRREFRNYGPDANHRCEERNHDLDVNYQRQGRPMILDPSSEGSLSLSSMSAGNGRYNDHRPPRPYYTKSDRDEICCPNRCRKLDRDCDRTQRQRISQMCGYANDNSPDLVSFSSDENSYYEGCTGSHSVSKLPQMPKNSSECHTSKPEERHIRRLARALEDLICEETVFPMKKLTRAMTEALGYHIEPEYDPAYFISWKDLIREYCNQTIAVEMICGKEVAVWKR